jgi:hypothetical protein
MKTNDRRRAAALLGVCFLFAALARPAAAQPQPPDGAAAQRPPVTILVPAPGVLQRIELVDGSVMYGRATSFDADRVAFEPSAGGTVEIPRGSIISLKVVRGRMLDGVFQPAIDAPTRLFFAPTARPIPAGEATFGIYEVFMPFLQVGVTNYFSIGGGTPLVFGGEGARPVWVTPKLTVYSRNDRSVAAGVIHIFGLDEGTGIAYGVGTFGPPEAAVTVGVGYAYAGKSRSTIVMVGGEKQISRRVQFITENWFWRGGYGIVSAGVRFSGEHMSADVGLGIPLGAETTVTIPLVNFTYRF